MRNDGGIKTRDRRPKTEDQKIKNPEVVLNPFVSASSLLVDPCQTCCLRFFVSCVSAICTRAPGSPPTGKTCSTPRDSILPSTIFLFSSTSTLL